MYDDCTLHNKLYSQNLELVFLQQVYRLQLSPLSENSRATSTNITV